MEPQFESVYVNQDGTVREVSPKEQKYLLQKFIPGDSGRPYIKGSYEALDGWGSKSGFMPRKLAPANIIIQPVNPSYDTESSNKYNLINDLVADHKLAGDKVVKNADGSITIKLNREAKAPLAANNEAGDVQSLKENARDTFRRLQLERQAERESLARHPDYR